MQREVSRGSCGSLAWVESEERREGGNTFSAMLRPIGFPYGEIRRLVSAPPLAVALLVRRRTTTPIRRSKQLVEHGSPTGNVRPKLQCGCHTWALHVRPSECACFFTPTHPPPSIRCDTTGRSCRVVKVFSRTMGRAMLPPTPMPGERLPAIGA